MNTPNDTSQEMRGLLKVAELCTALALGGALASLQALTEGPRGLSFHFSGWTVLAFAAGVGAALLYWKYALGSYREGRRKAAFIGMAVFGLGMFFYPLRYVPADKMKEIAIGLATAACALCLGAFLLWRLARFFAADGSQKKIRRQGARSAR